MNDVPHFTTLLVDDVRELRLLMRVALESSGRFKVIGEAEDGEEAVFCARKHQPDLVVLDISMPVQDGLEALPQVLEAAPGSKVVMLSALDERTHRRTALERGAVAYLKKDIEPTQLVEELVRVMETRAA